MPFAPIEAIKDLLTGSIWEKFKEMIEPYALVNAIVFLALNLALVYPAMGNLASTPFFTALAGASDIWKLAAGTIVLFVFSYLINHLRTLSLDFASGEIFRDFPSIGGFLKWWQKKRYKKLVSESENTNFNKEEDYLKRDEATFRRAYEFPVKETELGLTRLGNLLLSPASYVAHQYGASMQLAWPTLHDKLTDDDKTVKIVQGNWTTLLFFTSLYGLLILVAIELIGVAALGGKGIDIWQIIALLIFAAIFHYASLTEAREWGGGMRRIFDSHIKEYFSNLGMDGLKDLNPASSDYTNNWEDVTGWLAYGAFLKGEYPPKPEWYKTDPVSSPEESLKLKHPDFLQVKTIPSHASRECFSHKEGKGYLCIKNTTEYFFAVTNTSTGENPLSGKEAYLLVQDAGVTPPQTVIGHISRFRKSKTVSAFDEIPVEGKRQPGDPAGLLFPLGDIPPGSSRVLTYSFDSVLANVTANTKLKIKSVVPGKEDIQLFIDIFPEQIPQDAKTSLRVELLDDAPVILNKYAELFKADISTRSEGDMTEGGRTGMWHLKPEDLSGREKIRIWIRRNKGG